MQIGRLFLAVTMTISLGLNAQNLVSKKGEPYLPEKADWAIGFDAVPFLDYAGRLLSQNGSNAPTINTVSGFPLQISGKYFQEEKKAIRARLRIGVGSSTDKNSVIDMVNTTLDTVYTQDVRKQKGSNILLGIGREWRRGKTRLQGFYGYEGMLSITSSKTTYQYGNQFSSTFPTVYATDFSTPSETGFTSSIVSGRTTQIKSGTAFGLGLRGFIGAEYFIFPKVSIAGELGWGFMFKNANDGNLVTESWDNINNGVKSRSLVKAGGSSFGVDTDNAFGSISLQLYF
jgi:hypothetical protein